MNEMPAALGGRGKTWTPDPFQTWYAGEEKTIGHDRKESIPSLAPSKEWEKNLPSSLKGFGRQEPRQIAPSSTAPSHCIDNCCP